MSKTKVKSQNGNDRQIDILKYQKQLKQNRYIILIDTIASSAIALAYAGFGLYLTAFFLLTAEFLSFVIRQCVDDAANKIVDDLVEGPR